jgi:beta-glucanase (GH16 family)
MDFAKDYHTYAAEWSADKIVWYVDGVERRRYTGAGIPQDPMYVVAILAVGAAWEQPPGSSTPFPSTFDIDYIKVWQR